MVELGLSVVLLLVLVVAVHVRRRRAGHASRGDIRLSVIAALAAVLPAIARLLGVSTAVLHALAIAPVCAYVLFGVVWLIRHRKEVAAAWRAETEEDRRRGLR